MRTSVQSEIEGRLDLYRRAFELCDRAEIPFERLLHFGRSGCGLRSVNLCVACGSLLGHPRRRRINFWRCGPDKRRCPRSVRMGAYAKVCGSHKLMAGLR